jgi:hypothetical protein
MPVLNITEPRGKRRAPVWLFIGPLAVILVVAGAFVWGWFRPVKLELGSHGIGFGYGFEAAMTYHRSRGPQATGFRRVWFRKVPPFLGTDFYLVWCY